MTDLSAEPPVGASGQGSAARALATISQSIFYVSMPFFILNLLLPVLGRQIGAQVVEVGLFFSAFSVMTLVLRPAVGWGLDRYGRRSFFIVGLAGYAVTMASFAFVGQVWGIIAARVVQGISSSLLWLSANAIVADTAGEGRRGQSFGGVAQANARGAIVGTFIGFTVLGMTSQGQGYSAQGWTLLFLGYAAASLAAMLLALRRLPETNPSGRQAVRRPIVWSRTWVLLLLVTAVTGASAAMLSPVLIIFLQDRLRVGVETLAWAFLPSALVWALLPSRLGQLADRFGRKSLMVLGLVVAAGSSFFIPGLSSVLWLTALWALQALCYAAGDPAEQALVADLSGGDQRGRAYGLYAFAADLGATVGPLGGSYLYQVIGPHAPFYANGIILALCAALLWAFLRVPARSTLVPE